MGRGESGPESDIDLLVILDDDAPADKQILRARQESRRGHDRPVDVVPVRDTVYRVPDAIPGATCLPRLRGARRRMRRAPG